MSETWPCRFCERPLSEHDTDNGDSPEAQVCAMRGDYEPLIPGRALSFKQPWLDYLLLPKPWAKDFENRSRRNSAIHSHGPLWLHASLNVSRRDFDFGRDYAARLGIESVTYDDFMPQNEQRGGIIGIGQFGPPLQRQQVDDGWKMAGKFPHPVKWIMRVPFVPCSGALSVWQVPTDVIEQLRAVVTGRAT